MIGGEAMSQATRTDEELADQIDDAREIINLRNVIVHGYTVVENETIWGIVQADVPRLRDQMTQLLKCPPFAEARCAEARPAPSHLESPACPSRSGTLRR